MVEIKNKNNSLKENLKIVFIVIVIQAAQKTKFVMEVMDNVFVSLVLLEDVVINAMTNSLDIHLVENVFVMKKALKV